MECYKNVDGPYVSTSLNQTPFFNPVVERSFSLHVFFSHIHSIKSEFSEGGGSTVIAYPFACNSKLSDGQVRVSIKSKFTSQFRTVVGLIMFRIIMCLELVAEEGIRAETERKLDILSFVGILLLRKERNKIGG